MSSPNFPVRRPERLPSRGGWGWCLTKVGAFQVDVSLEGSLILCRQVDQPGMIGSIGSVLLCSCM
jgi:hypothetical protein